MIKKEVPMQHPRSATIRSDPRQGGIISGLLFAGMMVFLMMLVTGAIVTRTVRVRTADGEHRTNVAIDTPAGRFHIRAGNHMSGSVDGIPVYPGAFSAKDGGVNFEWTSKDGDSDKDLNIVGGEFRTKDSVSQVAEFYRRQLPSLMIVSRHNDYVRLEYKDGGFRRIISIEEHHGETRIGVASIADRASN
jgi:hypothetical protein